jgi:hypothetical protein
LNQLNKIVERSGKGSYSGDYSMLLYIIMAGSLVLLIAVGIYILIVIDEKQNKM